MLTSHNVIIDSVNTAEEWKLLLPDQNIVSLFFAPNDPKISLKRIIQRAKDNSSLIHQRDVQERVDGSKENIMNIANYDYWIDTTSFHNVLPTLKSIILHKSFYYQYVNTTAIPVKDNPKVISQLQENYNVDLTELIASFFE